MCADRRKYADVVGVKKSGSAAGMEVREGRCVSTLDVKTRGVQV